MATKLFAALKRRKTIKDDNTSQLARVLNLLDLTGLGVGGTLGLGVYVLAGSVAKDVAGPAVCLSFLVAAIASAAAGLCYAEFAARVPKAGSAYIYSYVSVGEFVAYIIGWNLILEYVIGTASVARGLSNYIDALANNTIKEQLEEWMPMKIDFLSPYPDFLSFIFVMILTALLAFGVKESSRLNNLFTALNLTTIAIVIVSGIINADPYNWNIPKNKVPPTTGGNGGFIPFGISGIMAGAAKCFYGFVGFDSIATTGEEAKNPQRNIPLAIIISLIIIFLAYFSISIVLTMMVPYYEQDANAPFPHVFDKIGWYTIKWIVTIGAVFALFTSLLGAMFPLPRVIYAMSNDSLIFHFLSSVHPWTKTPLLATILSGLLAGTMAILFDLNQLIDMMSIGTLLAYTIVAVCVLILRYQPNDNYYEIKQQLTNNAEMNFLNFFKLLYNLNMNKQPNELTSLIAIWSLAIFSIFTIGFCAFVIYGIDSISIDEPHYLILFIIIVIIMINLLIAIGRQPVNTKKLSFKVPWVPFIPCASILINLYLMLQLDGQTWIRFIVWLIIGFLIYFFYGIRRSEEGKFQKKIQEINLETIKENNEITKF